MRDTTKKQKNRQLPSAGVRVKAVATVVIRDKDGKIVDRSKKV